MKEEVERIYSLLSHSNGLKIRDIYIALKLDKYYVAEILFSTQNRAYWYQDDNSLWFPVEGALQIDKTEEEGKKQIIGEVSKFNIDRFLQEGVSGCLKHYLEEVAKFRICSNEEIKELFNRLKNGDGNAFELIVKSQQRFIANIAFIYRGNGVPLEDIIQEGNIGLIKAIERFDYSQNFSFIVYARSWILQAISSYMTCPYLIRLPANQVNLHREINRFKEQYETSNGCVPSMDDIKIELGSDKQIITLLNGVPSNLRDMVNFVDDLDCFESEENKIEWFEKQNYDKYYTRSLLTCLKSRQRDVVQSFYGINKSQEDYFSIGQRLDLTRERVRQILSSSVQKLKDFAKTLEQQKTTSITSIGYKRNASDSDNKEKSPYLVYEREGVRVGDYIRYNNMDSIVRKIIVTGSISKLLIQSRNGVFAYIINDNSQYYVYPRDESSNQSSNSRKKPKNSKRKPKPKEIREEDLIKRQARNGDRIIYESRQCVVLGTIPKQKNPRLVVIYDDETIDNIKDDPDKYMVVK